MQLAKERRGERQRYESTLKARLEGEAEARITAESTAPAAAVAGAASAPGKAKSARHSKKKKKGSKNRYNLHLPRQKLRELLLQPRHRRLTRAPPSLWKGPKEPAWHRAARRKRHTRESGSPLQRQRHS